PRLLLSFPPRRSSDLRSVGTYRFKAGTAGAVTISNTGTKGFVIVDAVRFVPAGALEKDVEMAMGVPREVREQIAAARAQVQKLRSEEHTSELQSRSDL